MRRDPGRSPGVFFNFANPPPRHAVLSSCRSEGSISYFGMQTVHRFAVIPALTLVAVFLNKLHSFAQGEGQDLSPKTYPDLDGTVWNGIDFQGKKYSITFHTEKSQKKLRILQRQDESIEGGTFSVVTDPPQRAVGGTYSFVGPAGSISHGIIPTFQIKFQWLGGPGPTGQRPGLCQMQGRLDETGIYMDYVEPVVIDINYASLFGKAVKGKQWYGQVIDCLGHDVSILTDPHVDGVGARKMLEEELSSGPMWGPGPHDLGEVRYSQGSRYVCFVRDNLFILADRLTLPQTPEADKEFEAILYKVDSAIRDEDPVVTILRMPKLLQRTQ